MNAPSVAAVILAGGKGERLGGIVKANLVIGGKRLLERATLALSASASPILVAHGPLDPALLELGEQHIPIPDPISQYAGPLAGVAAAAAWCLTQDRRPDFLISMAVDTPFFPRDFVARTLAAMTISTSAIVARYDGQDYPTNALWRLDSIRALPARIADGTAPRSLKRLAAEVGASYLDWPRSETGDPFANVNTPADLEALSARAEMEREPVIRS